jgi:hypothetical protein
MRVTTRRSFMSPMNGDEDKGQRAVTDTIRSEGVRTFPYLVDYRGVDDPHIGFSTFIRLPTSDLRYGDILVAVTRIVAGSGSYTWPSGWNELADSNADGSVDAATIAYRSVNFDSNEAAYVQPSYSAGTERSASVCWQFRNAGTPVVSSVVSANTASPDPPNLAPGLGTLNFLWIALATCEASRAVNSYPTNYTLNQGLQGGGTGLTNAFATLVWAMRELSASSENPGTFSLTVAEDSMSWTIAIPPA